MTHQEFFRIIWDTYQEARNLKFGNGGYNLSRGKARPVPSFLEDLFGLYVAQLLDRRDIKLLVDQSVFYGRKFQPDLLIVANGILTHYFDIKTNLGWSRDLFGYLNEKNELVKTLRGCQASYIDTCKTPLTISENLIYQIVVLHGDNINQNLLKDLMNHASALENIKFYVLFGEETIGGDRGAVHSKMLIREAEFNRLDDDIKTLLP